jgi:hypothetical protein
LLLFLPEEPEPSVDAISNLKNPVSLLRPPHARRRHLLLRWRNAATRLVPSVVGMARQQFAQLKRRSAAVSTWGARRVRLAGVLVAARLRANWSTSKQEI